MKSKKRGVIIGLFILFILIVISVTVFLNNRSTVKYSTPSDALYKISEYSLKNLDNKIYIDDTLYDEYKYFSKRKPFKETLSNNLFYASLATMLLEDGAMYATVDKAYADTMLVAMLNPSDDIWYEKVCSISNDTKDSLDIYDFNRYSFVDEYTKTPYNSIFLSEYATSNFTGNYFEFFTGEPVFFPRFDVAIENMSNRLENAFLINDSINTVWIMLDPFNTEYSLTDSSANAHLDDLCRIINLHGDVRFNVFLYSPNSYIWNKERKRFDEKIASYQTAILKLSELSNATISFPGYKEWCLANKALFSDTPMDERTMIKLVGDWIAGNHYIDSESIQTVTESLIQYCQKYRYLNYKDLSDYKIVFFGDSIIGNYHDATGISALTNTMCNIKTVNRAIGGTNATYQFLPEVLRYFSETNEKSDFYLINYGFNDYAQLLPIDGPESYTNGLTDGIREIRKNDPEAKIIIAAPYYSLHELSPEESQKVAGPLYDFAIAGQRTAYENDCYFINFYVELNLESNNKAANYLDDKVHLNEYGRLKYTELLVSRLERWTK